MRNTVCFRLFEEEEEEKHHQQQQQQKEEREKGEKSVKLSQ